MLKLWLKKLELKFNCIDIIQFGSSVVEEKTPKDLDIVVIFDKIPVKEQLEEAQKIKKYLQQFSEIPIHITSFDLDNFFKESNFAREGILFYGKSLFSKNYFAKRFGLSPKIQISYSLKNLKKKDKVRFNYLLKGRGGNYGILKKYNGKLLNPGLIEILPEYEEIFDNQIKKIINKFQKRKILEVE